MFVKVRENTYVNLEQVEGITLYEGDYYCWHFFVDEGEPIESDDFKTKEEALKWFNESIEPALNYYYKAKISAPLDIATYQESIAVILDEIEALLKKRL